MVEEFSRDGSFVDRELLERLGVEAQVSDADVIRTSKSELPNERFNFVGFLSNSSGQLYYVLPKHYQVKSELKSEFSQIFHLINRTTQGKREPQFGPQSHHIETNYPFQAFFRIHDYFTKFGIYYDSKKRYSLSRGKLDWKKTINTAAFYPVDGRVIMHPFVYKHGHNTVNPITDAMVYAINHTAATFGTLLNITPINFTSNLRTTPQSFQVTIAKLLEIRARTFNDRILSLIDALVDYFQSVDSSKAYYFKCRNFARVWEEAVEHYLDNHFTGLDSDGLALFSSEPVDYGEFDRARVDGFNASRVEQSLEYDHFWVDQQNRIQYIFDAKYYRSLDSLDYKQLSYTILQSTRRGFGQLRTYSALVMPSTGFSIKSHFRYEPEFGEPASQILLNIEIYEVYLDARTVLLSFSRA